MLNKQGGRKHVAALIQGQISSGRINLTQCVEDDDLNYFKQINTDSIKRCLFWNNKITNKGVIILSQSKWNNLIVLDLDKNQISNQGMKYLARISIQKLQQLNLCSNYISDEGILHLSKRSLPNLRIFLINDNKMTFNCFFYLNKLNSKNLNKLMLCNELERKLKIISHINRQLCY